VPTAQDQTRPAHAVEPEADGPVLDFAQDTPYDAYVGASALHRLQHTVTDEPAEMPFLVVSQIMELYFGLLRYEWRRAIVALRADDIPGATAILGRSRHHLAGLNASWASLSWMTPREFNAFRPDLGEGSGFQSAMYRHVELLLGSKSRQLLAPHRHSPAVYEALVSALESASLYDEVLAALARRGHEVPGEVLARDFSLPYVPDDRVEAVWVAIYRDEPALELSLGEELSALALDVSDWKYAHLAAVRRTMGAKPGTGGSSGLAWLERSLANAAFPELWSARTQV